MTKFMIPNLKRGRRTDGPAFHTRNMRDAQRDHRKDRCCDYVAIGRKQKRLGLSLLLYLSRQKYVLGEEEKYLFLVALDQSLVLERKLWTSWSTRPRLFSFKTELVSTYSSGNDKDRSRAVFQPYVLSPELLSVSLVV